jgi:hypothetical protein
MDPIKNARLLAAARALVEEVASHLDIDASVKLWDGSLVPLGREVRSNLKLTIASPGTVASLVRWPTLDRLIRHYAQGNIGLEDGTLIDLGHLFAGRPVRARLKELGVPTFGRGLDFRDPWGNLIQVVDYRDVQFTKTDEVLRAMDLEGLEKSDRALEELRAKGVEA